MMMVGKVLSRGQVTLPKSVRKQGNVRAGDLVTFEVIGPGRIELRVLRRMRLAEALELYRIEGPVEEAGDRSEWQAHAAEEVVSQSE